MIDIPGYKIIQELGQGGMASVYLAVQQGLERHVAIKVMAPHLSADSSFSDRFLREARILASMSHPNIITIFDVGIHESYHYIVMEYLPGETLGGKIKAGIKPDQALVYLKQLCLGLKFAHDKGFIHRDIKPENILFRGNHAPVITDFGVARAENSATKMTQTGMIIGTPHYMSPEQAQGLEIRADTDLYSLGIVFYEMLTGDVPYRADTTVAIMYKHVHSPIPDLPDELHLYQPLLNKLLAKHSDYRYQGGAEVVQDIEILEQNPSQQLATRIMPARKSVKVGTSPSIERVAKSSKGFPLSLIAGLVILFAGGVVAYSYFSESGPQQSMDKPLVSEKKTVAQKKREQEQARLERLRLEQIRQEQLRLEQEEQTRLEQERIAEQQEAQARKNAEQQRRVKIIREQEQKEAEEKKRKQASRQLQKEKTIASLLNQADTAMSRQKLKSAYRSYKRILQMDRNNSKARDGIALISERYLELAVREAEYEKFEQADKYLNNAISINPNHSEINATRKTLNNAKARYEENLRDSEEKNKKKEESIQERSFGGF